MSDTELIQELQGIGLSEKEARVYLAVLELGQDTVQHISEKAEVNRATTYVILESLATKGLVTTIGDEKKTVYVAEGPHSLNNIIHEQEEELQKKNDELDHILPELNTLYNLHPEKPVVRFYEGKEGIEEVIQIFLESDAEEGVEFFSATDVQRIFGDEKRRERREHRKIKKKKVRSIYTVDNEEPQQIERDEFTNAIQISSKKFSLSSDIVIFQDKVIIAALRGHLSGVLIENKEIAETLKNLFDIAFEGAKMESGPGKAVSNTETA